MRRFVPVFLLAALAAGDEPPPGVIPAVAVKRLVVPPGRGDATQALTAFLDGHTKDKAGDSDGALAGYLRFLGMPGRHELPARYVATARQRLDDKIVALRKRYDAACAVYAKNRAQGVDELSRLAQKYPDLPAGRAARTMWHSDRLRLEIENARGLAKEGKKKVAADALAQAVRRFPAALYRYEAKTLLLKLGGPNLFEPGERVGAGPSRDDPDTPAEEDEEEPTIEVGDG